MTARTSNSRSSLERPGRVKQMKGIIFQCDEKNIVGSWFIRPIEMIDRRLAGLGRSAGSPSLAMHAGIHVILEDGREFVVEQLVGSAREDFVDGQNWTPLGVFRSRDHGGWDVTIPASSFRRITEAIVAQSVEYLNLISPKPFVREDCTMLIERVFGKRRMFADSPTARTIGLGLRVGDPALPLLRPESRLDHRAEVLLRADTLRALPNPKSEWDAPNARLAFSRGLLLAMIIGGIISFSKNGKLKKLFGKRGRSK